MRNCIIQTELKLVLVSGPESMKSPSSNWWCCTCQPRSILANSSFHSWRCGCSRDILGRRRIPFRIRNPRRFGLPEVNFSVFNYPSLVLKKIFRINKIYLLILLIPWLAEHSLEYVAAFCQDQSVCRISRKNDWIKRICWERAYRASPTNKQISLKFELL